MAQAASRTAIWHGPGAPALTSSIVRGAPKGRQMAARILRLSGGTGARASRSAARGVPKATSAGKAPAERPAERQRINGFQADFYRELASAGASPRTCTTCAQRKSLFLALTFSLSGCPAADLTVPRPPRAAADRGPGRAPGSIRQHALDALDVEVHAEQLLVGGRLALGEPGGAVLLVDGAGEGVQLARGDGVGARPGPRRGPPRGCGLVRRRASTMPAPMPPQVSFEAQVPSITACTRSM